MDSERFDAITRVFAPATTRRKLLRWATVTGLVAAFSGAKATEASTCRYQGCGCTTGTRHQCVEGMVCCPSTPGMPGGAGTCQFIDDCPEDPPPPPACTWEGCTCNAGTYAPCDPGLTCCPDNPGLPGSSGTCQWGCPPPPCTGYGCGCTTGTLYGCDYGLTCCPDNPNVYGGPGTCLPDYQCAPPPSQCIDAGCPCEWNDPLGCGGGLVCCAVQSGYICAGFDQCCRGGGTSCSMHSQCCSGRCWEDGTCAY